MSFERDESRGRRSGRKKIGLWRAFIDFCWALYDSCVSLVRVTVQRVILPLARGKWRVLLWLSRQLFYASKHGLIMVWAVVWRYPISLLVVPGVVLLSVYSIPKMIDWSSLYGERIQRYVEQSVERSFSFQDIAFAILPTPRLVLYDVVLRNIKGGGFDDSLYARRLSMTFKWWSLLRGSFDVQNIDMHQGVLYLETLQKGVHNWDFAELEHQGREASRRQTKKGDGRPAVAEASVAEEESVPFHALGVSESVIVWRRAHRPCYEGMEDVFRDTVVSLHPSFVVKKGLCAHVVSVVRDVDIYIDRHGDDKRGVAVAGDDVDFSFLYRHELHVEGRVESIIWQGWSLSDGYVDFSMGDGELVLDDMSGGINDGFIDARGFIEHTHGDGGNSSLSYGLDLACEGVAFPDGEWLTDWNHNVVRGHSSIDIEVEGDVPSMSMDDIKASLQGEARFLLKEAYVRGPYARGIMQLLEARHGTGFLGVLAEAVLGSSLAPISSGRFDVAIRDGVIKSDNIQLNVGHFAPASQEEQEESRRSTQLRGWLEASIPRNFIESRLNIYTPDGGLFADVGLDIMGSLDAPTVSLHGIGGF